MATAKKVAMVITVSGDRPIQEVARDLKAAGFQVDHVMDIIGSITGSADPKIKTKLESVPGVSHVGEDHPVSI